MADRRWSELGPHVWVKILLLAGLLCVLFRTEIGEMVHLWLTDPSWSHGILIPLFSLYFVHQKRCEILSLEHTRDPLWERLAGRRPQRLLPNQTRPNYFGLLLLLLILTAYVFNVVSPAGYVYLRPISMIATVGAVVLFLGGWRLLRYTWLPITFFIFAIPLPRRYYVGVTMPMRQLSATIATTLALAGAVFAAQPIPERFGDRADTFGQGTVQLGDPSIDLIRNINATADRTVLTYRTSDGEGQYLRLAALSAFDEKGFHLVATDLVALHFGGDLPRVGSTQAVETSVEV
ncbi:MAG TPA: archaeosortase/exosortase family protein, partial [Sedimentisphaerales bacterium]|nr:archaeosortase/exosortase family protein [Sedimentisphaerales bacterium]